jgi:hypothetical protein
MMMVMMMLVIMTVMIMMVTLQFSSKHIMVAICCLTMVIKDQFDLFK